MNLFDLINAKRQNREWRLKAKHLIYVLDLTVSYSTLFYAFKTLRTLI